MIVHLISLIFAVLFFFCFCFVSVGIKRSDPVTLNIVSLTTSLVKDLLSLIIRLKSGPEVIKLLSCSFEHENLNVHKYKNFKKFVFFRLR